MEEVKMEKEENTRKDFNETDALKSRSRFHRPVQCILLGVFLSLCLCLTPTTAVARSRYTTLKIPVSAQTEQKRSIDSLVRSLPGVFSTSWSPRHHLIVVVYDRTMTSRRQLMKALSTLLAQSEDTHEHKESRQTSD
jgi:hypothetical protein